MRNLPIILILFILFRISYVSAQVSPYVRLIDGQSGEAVLQTADDGYLIIGNTPGQQGGIVKTDAASIVSWNKIYSTATLSFPNVVFRGFAYCGDGNYIVCGSIINAGGTNLDGLIMKLDPNGDTLWSKNVNEAGYNINLLSVAMAADTGFVFAGTAAMSPAGILNFFIMKTDSAGNKLWSNTYSGGNNMNIARQIKATPDSGAVVIGYTENFPPFDPGAAVLKVSSSGNLQWANKFKVSNSTYDSGSDVLVLPDGYLYLLSTDLGAVLIKTDTSGSIVKDTIYSIATSIGQNDYKGSRLKLLSDGNYMLSSGNEFTSFTMKIDTAFAVIWSNSVLMRGYDIIETAQHDFHIVGGGPLYGVSPSDPDRMAGMPDTELGIVHTDSLGSFVRCYGPQGNVPVSQSIVTSSLSPVELAIGQVGSVSPIVTSIFNLSKDSCVSFLGSVNEGKGVLPLQISPNPGSGRFIIADMPQGKGWITVYNEQLKEILHEEAVGARFSFSLENFPDGIYLCKLTLRDGRIFAGKIILSH